MVLLTVIFTKPRRRQRLRAWLPVGLTYPVVKVGSSINGGLVNAAALFLPAVASECRCRLLLEER
jgi:hypothetical protein